MKSFLFVFFFFSLRILLHRWWRATWRGRTLPYHRSCWWRHQCQRRTAWYSWSWGCYGMVTFVIFFFFINPSILVILLLRSITLSNSVNEFFPWNFPIFCNETLWKSTFSPQNYFIHSWQDNHDAVAETAVVGYPHEIKGQGLWTIIIYYVYIDTERDDFFVA